MSAGNPELTPKEKASVGAVLLLAIVCGFLIAEGLHQFNRWRARREFAEKAVELFVKSAEYVARPSTNEIPVFAAEPESETSGTPRHNPVRPSDFR